MTAARWAAELLAGPTRRGLALTPHYARFDDVVLALTPPGAPRMPNGIETDVRLPPGEEISVGHGELGVGGLVVGVDDVWDARPDLRNELALKPELDVDPRSLLGWGPGLTPLGDDVLIGYVAGRALAGQGSVDVTGSTTALSRTLLLCAAQGELPEAAHRLLEDGDPDPLLHWGATSGRGLIVGLAAALRGTPRRRPRFAFEIPLPDGPRRFEVSLC